MSALTITIDLDALSVGNTRDELVTTLHGLAQSIDTGNRVETLADLDGLAVRYGVDCDIIGKTTVTTARW